MPGFSIAEFNPHTAALLYKIIRIALFCQLCVISQIDRIIKIMIGFIAHQNTVATHFVDDAIILLFQNPAAALGNLEIIVFQNKLSVEILIQINTTVNGVITFLLRLQGVVALLHILQFKFAVCTDFQRSLALRTDIGQQKPLQAILIDIVQHNLTAKGFRTFHSSLCLGGNLNTVCCAANGKCNASVLVEGCILNFLFTVDNNRSQCVPCVRNDIHDCIHTGNDVGRTGNGTVLAVFQYDGNCSHNALAVKAEILGHIGKFSTILLGIEIPISVQVAVCAVQVVGGNMRRVYIYKAVPHGFCIHIQPCHIIPRNKQFQAVTIAFRRIHFSALRGRTQYSHFFIGCYDIGVTVLAVAFLEDHIAGGQHINFKNAVILHTAQIGRSQVHFDTAVHIAVSLCIYIDRRTFCHIIDKIHTLFAIIAGHGDIDIVAAIVIVQIQPVVISVDFFLQNTINQNAGIRLSLGLIGIHITVCILCRHFINLIIFCAAAHQHQHRQYEKQAAKGYSF